MHGGHEYVERAEGGSVKLGVTSPFTHLLELPKLLHPRLTVPQAHHEKGLVESREPTHMLVTTAGRTMAKLHDRPT